ncbi:hypothetical protein [Paralcaligenes ginsengisoli]
MLRILCSCVLGLLALVTQALALRTFWQPVGSFDPVLVFFGWQVLAAFMMGLFMLSALPRHYHGGRVGAFAHIFAICLFLPVAGQVLFLSVILVAVLLPAADKQADSALVENPEFVTYLVSRVTHGGGARLRARLENRNGSTEDRMAAMVAVQTLPSHITGGMLRDLLSDPSEEIRLLAYGIVDGAEKSIMQEIFLAQEHLADAVTAAEKSDVNSRLAELHWELIYQNLVHGEVHRYTLERVEQYAHEALEQNNENASMWYLLGRCALLSNKPREAQEFLQSAQFYYFPADRLLPWQAEAAFLQRDYGRVGKLLGPLGNSTASPLLQPTVRYWSK